MVSRHKDLHILLDLSKAIDVVSVPVLIRKLEAVGIRGTLLSKDEDYLSNAIHCVMINEFVIDKRNITYGVPEGTVLGPTIFLVCR